MIHAVPIEALEREYPNERICLVCRPGFEQRSVVVAEALRDVVDSSRIFRSREASAKAMVNVDRVSALLGGNNIVELDVRDPFGISGHMLDLAKTISSRSERTVIDISSFRREELLIMLRMLAHSSGPDVKCDLVYVKAEQFASDWLSRNTNEFRSVVGYPGEAIPSRRPHLVVLLGFEFERARDIIENYEPARISVGCGVRRDHGNEGMYQRNRRLLSELKSLYGNTVDEFEFPLNRPAQVQEVLATVIAQGEFNHIIAPLNNKLSTLGVGVFAMRRPEVQVCYGVVEEYNESQYSTPANEAIILTLADLGLISTPSD